MKISNLIPDDLRFLLVFTKMPFACQIWIAIFALDSAPHPLFLNMFITIRIFWVAAMVHISGDKNLPICYQCLELKNTCLDFHQSENWCLITPFPPPFLHRSLDLGLQVHPHEKLRKKHHSVCQIFITPKSLFVQ